MPAEPSKNKVTKPKVHYMILILKAIASLKSTTGSSVAAIEKWIKDNNAGIPIKHSMLHNVVKKALESGKIKPNRYHSNSYMLCDNKEAKSHKKVTRKTTKVSSEKKESPKKRKMSKSSTDKPVKKAVVTKSKAVKSKVSKKQTEKKVKVSKVKKSKSVSPKASPAKKTKPSK